MTDGERDSRLADLASETAWLRRLRPDPERRDRGPAVASFGADLDYQVLVPRFIRVRPNGPAASAGFQDGDVIVSVDGVAVTNLSPSGVWILISNRSPGSKVKLGCTRAGKTITGDVTLGEAQ